MKITRYLDIEIFNIPISRSKYLNIYKYLLISLSIFFSFFLASSASAATLYWVGDAGANVGTAGNWKTTDPSSCGGGDAGAAPGASDVAVFDPDCVNSAAIVANWSVAGINIQSGYSGTVTQNTGVTLTVGASNYVQADGTFQGGNSTVDINGTFTLSGGTFNATSGTIYIQASNFTVSGGMFIHNSGTVLFDGAGGAYTDYNITADGVSLYNLSFNSNFGRPTIVGTITVLNDFSVTRIDTLSTGTIAVDGDIITSYNMRGNAKILLNSEGDQTINAGGQTGGLPKLEINKKSGTVDVSASGTFQVYDFLLSNGIFEAPSVMNITGEGSGGNFVVSNGIFMHNNGTLGFIAANGAYTYNFITAGSTELYNLTINGNYYRTVLGADLVISNELRITKCSSFSTSSSNYTIYTKDFVHALGTFDLNASVMKITGNFTRSGGAFTYDTSTVAFQGSNQTIDVTGAATTFYRLYKLVNEADTFTITAGNTITIAAGGIMRLWGKPEGKTLSIVSSSPGSSYTITKTGNFEAEYTSFQDMNLSGAATAAASTSVSGNTNLTVTKEFISTIRAAGGDYSTLSAWEAAVNVNLTAATTKVFSHGGVTGTIPDNSAVSGETSLATATAVHVTSTQILLKTISGGPFQSGEKVWLDADHNNYVILSDAGFGAIAVAHPYNDWAGGLDDYVTIGGWMTGANNYVKIYVPTTERHDGTQHRGFYMKRASGSGEAFISIGNSYTWTEGIEIDGDADNIYTGYGIALSSGVSYIKINGNLIYDVRYDRLAGVGYNNTYVKIYNNIFYRTDTIVYNNALAGIGDAINNSPAGFRFYNNTIYYNNGFSNRYCFNDGTKTSNTGTKLVNNIAYSATDGYAISVDNPDSATGYNLVSDTTAFGANSLAGNTLSDMSFVSTTAGGSEDLHITSHSVAKDNGYDLSVDPDFPVIDDIDGDSRLGLEPGAWDIGADEYQEVDPVVSLGGVGAVGAVGDEPVAYWKFDEGYGDTAHNSGAGCTDATSCVSTNGTLQSGGSGTNDTNTKMWDKSGKYGGAMEFDGVNDYVDVGDAFYSDALSVCAWVKESALKAQANVALKRNNSGTLDSGAGIYNEWELSMVNGSIKFNSWNAAGTSALSLTSSITINAGSWYHICAVQGGNGNTGYVYIDGAQQGSAMQTSLMRNADSRVQVGTQSNNTSSRFFNGLIDEVKIYDYALSAEQVKREYNQGQSMIMGGLSTESNGATSSLSASREYCVPGDTTACAAPVAEWKLDDNVSGDSQTVYDTSGNGNNGTTVDGANNTGMNCKTEGKFGRGCSFDGVDDYVDLGNMSQFQLQGYFSFGGWIISNYSGTEQTIISNLSATAFGESVGYKLDKTTANKYRCQIDNSDGMEAVTVSISSDSAYTDRNWHQVFCVVTNKSVRMYIDGKLQSASVSYSNNIEYSTNLRIGAYQQFTVSGTLSSYFNGSIDQVRIYNYARTPAQIAWEYNKGKPVAHWRMDETSGNTVHNETSNSLHGTCQNMEDADWMSGKFGNSLSFDGSNEYVEITNPGSVLDGGGITVSAWIKPAAYTKTYPRIVDRGITSSGQFSLWINQSTGKPGITLNTSAGGTVELDSSAANCNAIPLDQWTHVAFTYNSSNGAGKMSLNGQECHTYGITAYGLYSTSSAIWIGERADAGDSRAFTGQIDDVRVYNYPLTAEQVEMVMNEGNAVRY